MRATTRGNAGESANNHHPVAGAEGMAARRLLSGVEPRAKHLKLSSLKLLHNWRNMYYN